jgi:single-strand DNA-binding protein
MQVATIILSNATVVRDPEAGQTPSGITNVKFTAVVNHGRRDDEQADFYAVTVWGKQAETMIMLKDTGALTKGARVDIVGRLTHRTYKGRDGQDKMSIDVNANDVILVSPPKGHESGGGSLYTSQNNVTPSVDLNDINQIPF